MDGSNGNVVSLLERVLEELVKTREEVSGLRAATREELGGLRADMNRGFAQVNARIDNVLAIAGRHHDDHEERIQVLEQHVLGKSG